MARASTGKCKFDTSYTICDRPTGGTYCDEHIDMPCRECENVQATHLCGYGSNYTECEIPLCGDHGSCGKHEKEFQEWMDRIDKGKADGQSIDRESETGGDAA